MSQRPRLQMQSGAMCVNERDNHELLAADFVDDADWNSNGNCGPRISRMTRIGPARVLPSSR